MIVMGLTAVFGMEPCFKRFPGNEARAVYDKFYFAPYFLMIFPYVIFAIAGHYRSIGLWSASFSLGFSLFSLFFVDVGGISHDFGHVIYGGCFESVGYERTINISKTFCIIISVALIIASWRQYRVVAN
jgi:hypothetical protein